MPEFDSSVSYRLTPRLPEDFYTVGSDGSVWSCSPLGRGKDRKKQSRWRRLKDRPLGKGYRAVGTATQKTLYVHHLVLEAFVGPRPASDFEACHNNGDPSDNRLVNLRWGTREDNRRDMLSHGTQRRGSAVGNSKLTETIVREMRQLRSSAGISYRELGKRFCVNTMTAFLAVSGKTWQHVQ